MERDMETYKHTNHTTTLEPLQALVNLPLTALGLVLLPVLAVGHWTGINAKVMNRYAEFKARMSREKGVSWIYW